jgi:hypothetical protein
MAEYRTTIHHKNFTAVGRGWNVTTANRVAVSRYMTLRTIDDPLEEHEMVLICKLANEVRSARRGGAGEVKWRIDRDKSFIIVERV